MKIRNGFVSNSSSASFVIVGLELTKGLHERLEKYARDNEIEPAFESKNYEDFNIYEFADHFELDVCVTDYDGGIPSEGGIGYCICDSGGEDYFEYSVTPFMEFYGKADKLLEITNKTKADLSVITGTREA